MAENTIIIKIRFMYEKLVHNIKYMDDKNRRTSNSKLSNRRARKRNKNKDRKTENSKLGQRGYKAPKWFVHIFTGR